MLPLVPAAGMVSTASKVVSALFGGGGGPYSDATRLNAVYQALDLLATTGDLAKLRTIAAGGATNLPPSWPGVVNWSDGQVWRPAGKAYAAQLVASLTTGTPRPAAPAAPAGSTAIGRAAAEVQAAVTRGEIPASALRAVSDTAQTIADRTGQAAGFQQLRETAARVPLLAWVAVAVAFLVGLVVVVRKL